MKNTDGKIFQKTSNHDGGSNVPRINQNTQLPINQKRDQKKRLFPFFAIRRDLFEIGKALGLEVTIGEDDFQYFFELWANVDSGDVFAIARYRTWYIEVDEPSTWKFRDIYSPVFAKRGEQNRIIIFTALAENLSLAPSELMFLDDDENVVPRPRYLPLSP